MCEWLIEITVLLIKVDFWWFPNLCLKKLPLSKINRFGYTLRPNATDFRKTIKYWMGLTIFLGSVPQRPFVTLRRGREGTESRVRGKMDQRKTESLLVTSIKGKYYFRKRHLRPLVSFSYNGNEGRNDIRFFILLISFSLQRYRYLDSPRGPDLGYGAHSVISYCSRSFLRLFQRKHRTPWMTLCLIEETDRWVVYRVSQDINSVICPQCPF